MADNPGWDRQTRPAEGKPHGWIQWKGTDVCMDVRCACGATCHIDAEFAYYVKCPHCQRVYMVNGHVELVELTPEEIPLAHAVQECESDHRVIADDLPPGPSRPIDNPHFETSINGAAWGIPSEAQARTVIDEWSAGHIAGNKEPNAR